MNMAGSEQSRRYRHWRLTLMETMTEHPDPVTLSTAGIHRRRCIPLVWIVPVLTALVAAIPRGSG